ncbi:MAG: SGNH/GDSL hydrolase family protein, partial [Oscillospiraceae bacterium]|nr:SGNH/GDSL hydrolase family protein [Oscillospiraceae bacterium]
VSDYVDAVEHSYENGSCKVCGAMASNPYAGKTIACIGDSITAAYGVTKDKTDYVKLLADRLEMNYIRLGASGTSLCANGGRVCNIDKLTESKLQGADVVTIAMGINDFCGAGVGYYELGDIHSTDSSTIYGAVRMWCEQIVELRKTDSLKDTEFYFVTPLITSWNNSVTSARNWDQSKVNIHGYTLRDLCNAIIEVAALYDVAVIDMNLISGLYYVSAEDNNIDVFGGDGVHPGDEGHAMMAAALEDALLKHYLLDDHDHSYGSWIITTYPDCEGGEEKRVCGICRATESRALAAIPSDKNVHLSQKAKLQPDGSFTFTLEIYASEKVALYGDAVIRYVLNQGFVMTEKSEVKAVRVSELLSDAVLYEVTVEATELTVTVDGGVLDVTGYDLSKSYVAQDHAGSKLVITISNVEATDAVLWNENMDISTADSGIWADGAMAVAFAKSSAFFHESVYVMDYAEEITLDGENIIHLDADGMGCFGEASIRLEMACGTAVVEEDGVVYTPGTMQWNGYDRFYAFAKENETYSWTKVAVIPANNVYYEDSFVATSAEDAAAGAGIYYTNGTKPEDVAQDVWDSWNGQWESVSDNKTGNSVENSSDVQGWIENLAGQTGFTGGSAHLVQAM